MASCVRHMAWEKVILPSNQLLIVKCRVKIRKDQQVLFTSVFSGQWIPCRLGSISLWLWASPRRWCQRNGHPGSPPRVSPACLFWWCTLLWWCTKWSQNSIPIKHMWILAKVRMDIWVFFFFRGTGYTKSSKYIQHLNLILPSTSHLGFKCGRGLPTYNTMPLPRTESLVIPLVQLQAPKARKVRGTCGHSFPKPPWIANQSM